MLKASSTCGDRSGSLWTLPIIHAQQPRRTHPCLLLGYPSPHELSRTAVGSPSSGSTHGPPCCHPGPAVRCSHPRRPIPLLCAQPQFPSKRSRCGAGWGVNVIQRVCSFPFNGLCSLQGLSFSSLNGNGCVSSAQVWLVRGTCAR
jgi:hypothetical protein